MAKKVFIKNDKTIGKLLVATECKSVAELGRKIGQPNRRWPHFMLDGKTTISERNIQLIEKQVTDPNYDFRDFLADKE